MSDYTVEHETHSLSAKFTYHLDTPVRGFVLISPRYRQLLIIVFKQNIRKLLGK